MSKKEIPRFFCTQCGNEFSRWEGRCPACGEWDTLSEAPREPRGERRGRGSSRPPRASRGPGVAAAARPLRAFAGERVPRWTVPIGEFHRVLGGGATPGASVLVGGEPGIGKSTLLLQVLGSLAAQDMGGARKDGEAADRAPRSLLFISGEEAPAQIADRGMRLAKAESGFGAPLDFEAAHLKLAAETDLEAILELLEREKPRAVVVDSIQTLRDPETAGAPGSVSQVRECAMALVECARCLGAVLFLIGHVTKEGQLAGPRVLEHMVDTVLSLEGYPRLGLRVLRAQKNRYGPTHEVGLFEMTGQGLREAPDPASVLLDREGAAEAGAGTTTGVLEEGTRVLPVTIQALTVPVPGGGSPRRRASGLDQNRLAMLLAVLEAKAGAPFGGLDVFASVAGGFSVDEPAADLPLALALASAASGRIVREGLASAGEVGLGGELRPVGRAEARLAEARRLGFGAVLLPARVRVAETFAGGVKVLRARTLREALALGLT